MKKLIVGCGYLGRRVASRWLRAGHQVWALTRTAAHAEQLWADGITPLVGDVTDPASLPAFPDVDVILYAVGFDRSAGLPIHDVYVDGLRNMLQSLGPSPVRFIYISSTGVYGQSDGEVVDERSECRPTREGGRACLAAEGMLAESAFTMDRVILRMAGIYGPGRIPRGNDILQGQPIAVPADGWLNLIHVDDAADVVLAVESLPTESLADDGHLYLVSDGHPVQRRTYYRMLAELLEAPSPEFIAPPADSPVADRSSADKRVSNARLRRATGMSLSYPSYREGLEAILCAERL